MIQKDMCDISRNGYQTYVFEYCVKTMAYELWWVMGRYQVPTILDMIPRSNTCGISRSSRRYVMHEMRDAMI